MGSRGRGSVGVSRICAVSPARQGCRARPVLKDLRDRLVRWVPRAGWEYRVVWVLLVLPVLLVLLAVLGATGPGGPPGPAGAAPQTVSITQDFGEVNGGALIQVTVSCPPGTVVVGGGSVTHIFPPNDSDTTKLHQLFSGPTSPTDWTTASTAVGNLSNNSDLQYTASATCIAK